MESARSYAEKKQCSRVEFRLKGSELSMVRGRMKKKKKKTVETLTTIRSFWVCHNRGVWESRECPGGKEAVMAEFEAYESFLCFKR